MKKIIFFLSFISMNSNANQSIQIENIFTYMNENTAKHWIELSIESLNLKIGALAIKNNDKILNQNIETNNKNLDENIKLNKCVLLLSETMIKKSNFFLNSESVDYTSQKIIEENIKTLNQLKNFCTTHQSKVYELYKEYVLEITDIN